MIDSSTTDKAYIYLTGRFLYRLSGVSDYVLVGYNYDGNFILAKAIKKFQAISVTTAWLNMNENFHIVGAQPDIYT